MPRRASDQQKEAQHVVRASRLVGVSSTPMARATSSADWVRPFTLTCARFRFSVISEKACRNVAVAVQLGTVSQGADGRLLLAHACTLRSRNGAGVALVGDTGEGREVEGG